jgi:hypothetical protein
MIYTWRRILRFLRGKKTSHLNQVKVVVQCFSGSRKFRTTSNLVKKSLSDVDKGTWGWTNRKHGKMRIIFGLKERLSWRGRSQWLESERLQTQELSKKDYIHGTWMDKKSVVIMFSLLRSSLLLETRSWTKSCQVYRIWCYYYDDEWKETSNRS